MTSEVKFFQSINCIYENYHILSQAKMKHAEEAMDREATPKLQKRASTRKLLAKKSTKKSGLTKTEGKSGAEDELERQRTALKEQKKVEKIVSHGKVSCFSVS